MSEHCITMTADEVKALNRGKTMHRIPLDPRWRWHRPGCAPSKESAATAAELFEQAGFGAVRMNEPIKGAVAKLDIDCVIADIPYKPGDVLVVQEEFLLADGMGDKQDVFYKSDGEDIPGPWTAAIHMPSKYARYRPKITAVRVERVQEITEEDALAEGLVPYTHRTMGRIIARYEFMQLWNTRHPKTPWEQNPFVVAITFEAVGAVKEPTT